MLERRSRRAFIGISGAARVGFGGEAFGEVVDHGDGDHAGGVVGSGFVVTTALALARNTPLPEAVTAAVHVGSHTVQHQGATSRTPAKSTDTTSGFAEP